MEENKSTTPDKSGPKSQAKLNPDNKPSYVWIYIVMAVLTGVLVLQGVFTDSENREVYSTEFDKMYIDGDISQIKTINGKKAIILIYPDSFNKKEKYDTFRKKKNALEDANTSFFMYISSHSSLEQRIKELRKQYKLKEVVLIPMMETGTWYGSFFNLFGPILLLIAFYFFMMRKMGGGGGGFPGGGIFSIGKSKATMVDKDAESDINFSSVAGLDEEKQEVMEIVDFLKNPDKYTALGGKIPKGALLIGPPGTGKTLLAKAMAGEAKVPFFSLSGSDFVEMFVGVGASRVRDLFKQAREKAPCIIFIDEIDAIGRARGKGMVGGNDERESTLNQLLVEMDGFSGDTGIIVIAATNRPDVLDDALLRAGRFDRQIHINRPDLNGREQIFNVHLGKIKKGEDISAHELAKQTPGFVGADIANVCNEAALVAARKNKTEVNMKDVSEAIDRVTTGLEKKNTIITPEEKKVIAYHEAGHALTSWYLEYAHPFVRVTIVPRSESLGHALYLPKEKYLTIKEELLDQICVSMGGRAAELLAYNKISTGALGDLDSVTRMAYGMVVYYGMSEKVGNLSFYKMAQNSYDKPYSDETAKLIDDEVRNISDEQFKRALNLLTDKREQLDSLASLLLEKEVLLKEDLEALLGKCPWDKLENINQEEKSLDTPVDEVLEKEKKENVV
ncbi:MAG: ATP-dependent zinc metalloprotease FtsH [Chitinophagales bacterium]|nr:ATP-dependent zinc metalloprotease FtsH [Sphingobacteriales bacterium]